MSFSKLVVLLAIGLVHVVQCQLSNVQPLSGLTVSRYPFVEKNKYGNYTGYFVDLMDEISRIGQFNYTLKESLIPRTIYNEKPENLIEEFMQRSFNRADFIIADYMFTGTSRINEVEFTEPYQTSGLSIILHRDRLTEYGIKNLDELLELQNRPRPPNSDGKAMEELAIGTVRSSNTYQQLTMSSDETMRKLYQRILPYSNNLVDSRENGIKRALSQPYALLQETLYNELAIDEHCELTQILVPTNDPSKIIPFKYAIALRRGSPYMEKFNRALREMKENGKLEELKRRYWNRKCNGAPTFNLMAKSILGATCVLLSMAISNFFLGLMI